MSKIISDTSIALNKVTVEKGLCKMAKLSISPTVSVKKTPINPKASVKKNIKVAKKDEGACSLFYGFKVKDSKGKIKRNVKKRRAHSFVTNFIKALFFQMNQTSGYGSGVANVDITGAASTVEDLFSPYWGIVEANSDHEGLVVGTDNTTEEINDYKLGAQLVHGGAAGYILYGTQAMSAPATDATTTSFAITRVFSNGSGGSIVVREIGLISRYSPYYLFARDVLSSAVTVADGEELTVNYTIQINV